MVHQIKLLSQSFQLTEDQEFELITNITGQAIKSYTPPPIIPIVSKSSMTAAESSSSSLSSVGATIPVILVPNNTPPPPHQSKTVKNNNIHHQDLDASIIRTSDSVADKSSPDHQSKSNNTQSRDKDPNIILKRFGRSLPSFMSKGSTSAVSEGGNHHKTSSSSSSFLATATNGGGPAPASVSKSRTTSHEDDEFAVL